MCCSTGERIVLSFNKAHNTDQSIPPWILKCKGQTHYVKHVNATVGFSTKETPDSEHTKGSLQFRGRLSILNDVAYITRE